MSKIKTLFHVAIAGVLCIACTDSADLEKRLDNLEIKIAEYENMVTEINVTATGLGSIVKGNIYIVGQTETENGYKLELSDNTVIEVVFGKTAPTIVPVIGINEAGNWIVSLDNGETFEIIEGAANALYGDGKAPQIQIDKDGYWTISYDGGETFNQILKEGKPVSAVDGMQAGNILTFFKEVKYDESTGSMVFTLLDDRTVKIPVIDNFYLTVKDFTDGQVIMKNQTLLFDVEMSDVKDAIIKNIPGWSITLEEDRLSVTAPSTGTGGEYKVEIILVSGSGLLKTVTMIFSLGDGTYDPAACKEWNDFIADNEDNLLLDFSYAGYMHGEIAPPDVYSLNYTVYDVTDYGAIPDDGLSDREAFLNTLKAALGVNYEESANALTFANKTSAKAIIYFPEGEFILHTAEDDVNGQSQSIIIRSGDFIIKGAGRNKTKIVIQDEMQPKDPSVMYSSPDMIQIKHNSTFSSFPSPATVTEDAEKGAFAVTVASAASISEGDWVCLHVKNNDSDFVNEELAPYNAATNWVIYSGGIEVIDYHQVDAIIGNRVIFKEPIMHAVDASRGWEVMKYPHQENVGIEDLTFVGHAKDDFVHHGSWADDGAFKPISVTRVTNSWMRRVDFVSVSEACSIISSANFSAYDITFSGNRGHSAIRSESSSRVFIGATADTSDGRVAANNPNVAEGTYMEGAGQYHGVGVSKPSMGAVLWRNQWGKDACFEAHATQPRATLIDCCTGGWMRFRQGGDDVQMPNHLADLTIWNFESTNSFTGDFIWWDSASKWWKFLPPIIVGFHGENVSFDQSQVLADSNHGTQVHPESLYEAQLQRRLGHVPGWLNELK